MKHKLERSNIQRLIALENAFKTIDAFAAPSLSPMEFEKYEHTKKLLINNYSSGTIPSEKQKYILP